MKVLYAVQGTGNGHLSRARDLIPALLKTGVDLDILVSGTQADLPLPFEVKYRFWGLSFIFGKQGGIDYWKTYLNARTLRTHKELRSLPVDRYDLVLNDFEPISAWACKLRNIPCIGISHQAAVLSPFAPQPERKDPVGLFVLRNYAPTTHQYGFHFREYEPGMFTPIIRQGIRSLRTREGSHYTVYLPAFSDQRIVSVLSRVKGVQWEVFSKHNTHWFEHGNVLVRPIEHEAFLSSMASCRGVLCAAGFETPSEALYLGKKLCVVPMKSQLEQQCNAAALAGMGVRVLESFTTESAAELSVWVDTGSTVTMPYEDIAGAVVDRVLEEHSAVPAHA
jgi:uncharacterized protein (TIGR00661 family)